jgi:chromate transporter
MDAPDGGAPPSSRRVRLSQIVLVFLWTGLTSIGGGRYAFFYDALVARRPWLRNEEFVQDLTLAQLLPGPTFSNVAVALGLRLGGWRGAVWGAGALVLPGALILLALSALYSRGEWSATTVGVMHAMSAAVVGLVLVTTARVVAASLRGGRAMVIAAATFVLVAVLQVNTALAIAMLMPASLWLHRPRKS